MSDLSTMLRAARLRAGYTQAALGAALGVTQSTVSHIERGDRGFTAEVLTRWVEVCGCRLRVLEPALDQLTERVGSLSPEHAALLARIAALAPGLQPADAQSLAILLGGWEPRRDPPAAAPPVTARR